MDDDLRRAAREGFLLLHRRGLGTVEREGRLIRYDPALDPLVRAVLIATLTNEDGTQCE